MKGIKLLSLLALGSVFACQQSQSIKVPGIKVQMDEQGTGEKAKVGDHVFFQVETFDHEGNLLQSSRENPDMPSIKISEPEQGKTNIIISAISQSTEGDSLTMFIPFDSLPGLPPQYANTELKYIVAIKDVMGSEEYDALMEEKRIAQQKIQQENQIIAEGKAKEFQDLLAQYKAGKLKPTTTASGLKYVVIEAGQGENVQTGQNVSVNYYGMLHNGERFDDSFSRGRSFDFTVGAGQVIKGWDEGLTYGNLGSRILLDIPAELGYGERGSPPKIPGNSPLIFFVEVNAIK